MILTKRARRKLNRDLEQTVNDVQHIVNRLSRLTSDSKGQSSLRISDEFAAIGRAAERAKWRTYKMYMELGREEIRRQESTKR
jgi:hypothetical protein